MAAILAKFFEMFEGQSDEYDLPVHQGDAVYLGDIFLDEDELNEYTRELAERAFNNAIYHAHNAHGVAFRCKFYAGMTKRVPNPEIDMEGINVWRMDVDNPVAETLMQIKQVAPISYINNYYGDQVVYPECDVDTAVATLIDYCSIHGFPVENCPEDLTSSEVDQEEHIVEFDP